MKYLRVISYQKSIFEENYQLGIISELTKEVESVSKTYDRD